MGSTEDTTADSEDTVRPSGVAESTTHRDVQSEGET